ncbi:MAG: YdcH family protein [Pacificimonas sp.]
MSAAHLDALSRKHADLETAIETESHRPNPDSVRLHDLKKKKLRVKEEMTSTAA